MKHIKIILVLFLLPILLIGCNGHKVKNHPIVENITLNKSTYKEIKKTLNINPESYYDEEIGGLNQTKYHCISYTINNVEGKLKFGFDDKLNKLLWVYFEPSEYSKESGDAIKTWIFDKYKDYDQTTKDTGFVFSNGNENVELYITENPIDDTEYHGLYIEWTVVE